MYRISNHVVKYTSVLTRRICPVELRIASFSRSPQTPAWYKKIRERDPCPPLPPPPLPPYKFNFFLIGTGVFLACTAGFIVLAKNNPEIRDWLSINAPWFDDIISVVYEENKPLKEGLQEYIDYFKEMLAKFLDELPEECRVVIAPPPPTPVPVADKAAIAESEEDEGQDEEKQQEEEDEDADEEEEEEEKECEIPEPPVITKDICKLEECLKETAEEIVNNYMTARDYCIYYNKLVKSVCLKFSLYGFKNLKTQKEEREEVIEKYINTMNTEAEERFNNLVRHVKCGVMAPKDRLAVTEDKISDYKDVIKRNKMEYEMEYERALVSDKLAKLVECLMDQYTLEITALYPELDLAAHHPAIDGDFDFLLIHTKKYVDSLSTETNDAVDHISAKITRAYNAIPVPKGKEKEFNDRLQAAYKKAKADLDKEFQDRLAQLKKDSDDELKAKLARQQKICEERHAQKFILREKQAQEKADRIVDEKVDAARKQFETELDQMRFQLNLVEDKLNERMKAERETKRAAYLYAAGASLLAATRKGDPRVKVNKELEILRNNSTDDELVTTVLNAIPVEVKSKGLVPESVIRDGYHSMEDVAMKVAMVEERGGPLPMYAFSWLQYMFLFMKPTCIPQVELDQPPKEPFTDMDTFDLLQRARYFMSKGNLASAVRYVDALEGASRGAAEGWYQSANALLQTRQAAEAILAHAAAISLQYL